jgi:hypothetical protein
MSMRPPTAHRHPHSNARQFDLFCDPPTAAAQTPQWQALPAETRHTLTKLMVRLIFGHADGDVSQRHAEGNGTPSPSATFWNARRRNGR